MTTPVSSDTAILEWEAILLSDPKPRTSHFTPVVSDINSTIRMIHCMITPAGMDSWSGGF